MREELKPCLKCGKKAKISTFKSTGTNFTSVSIYCTDPKCSMLIDLHDTVESAIADWNYRPLENALREEISKLTEARNDLANNYERVVHERNTARCRAEKAEMDLAEQKEKI